MLDLACSRYVGVRHLECAIKVRSRTLPLLLQCEILFSPRIKQTIVLALQCNTRAKLLLIQVQEHQVVKRIRDQLSASLLDLWSQDCAPKTWHGSKMRRRKHSANRARGMESILQERRCLGRALHNNYWLELSTSAPPLLCAVQSRQ